MALQADLFRRDIVLRSATLWLALVAGLGALAGLLYFRDRDAERRIHEQAGFSMVDLATDTISREAAFVGSDLLYLRHQQNLEALLDGVPGSRERLEAGYLEFCRLKESYDRIRILDVAGREIVRVDHAGDQPSVIPQAELGDDAGHEDFQRAIQLARDEVYVSGLDLSVEHGRVEQPLKPTIRFAAPIFDSRGTRRGVVALDFLGRRLLQALADAAAGFSGKFYLLDKSGFYLRGPRPEDEWGFALGHDRRFDRDHPAAWAGQAGLERGQYLDRQGLFTFRKVHLTRSARAWLPEDELIVVAWVPREVLQEASRRLRDRLLLAAAVVFPVLLAAAWYVSHSTVLRRTQERQIAESEARLRRLSAELLDAQERERASLSRDLHDDLGQLSTSVTLDLERARQADGDKRDRMIERALGGSRLLLSRMHEIAARIRPRILDDLGLRDAVRSYLAEFSDRTGIEVESELNLDSGAIPGPLSENAYRILQEALTNVAKHAGAQHVWVAVRQAPDGLCLRVRDDGVGFAVGAASSAGLGLLGMRERVELLRGRLVVHSEPGQGTSIEATLPMGARPA